MIHNIKTLQPYFNDVKSGKKTFELRKDDRNYQAGDTLWLLKYDANNGHTGQIVSKTISYILRNCPQYGLKDGYCILGII